MWPVWPSIFSLKTHHNTEVISQKVVISSGFQGFTRCFSQRNRATFSLHFSFASWRRHPSPKRRCPVVQERGEMGPGTYTEMIILRFLPTICWSVMIIIICQWSEIVFFKISTTIGTRIIQNLIKVVSVTLGMITVIAWTIAMILRIWWLWWNDKRQWQGYG